MLCMTEWGTGSFILFFRFTFQTYHESESLKCDILFMAVILYLCQESGNAKIRIDQCSCRNRNGDLPGHNLFQLKEARDETKCKKVNAGMVCVSGGLYGNAWPGGNTEDEGDFGTGAERNKNAYKRLFRRRRQDTGGDSLFE